MAEWLKAPVLKTGDPLRGPGVRIPRLRKLSKRVSEPKYGRREAPSVPNSPPNPESKGFSTLRVAQKSVRSLISKFEPTFEFPKYFLGNSLVCQFHIGNIGFKNFSVSSNRL